MAKNKQYTFVLAARIAAHLHHATVIAKRLSLTAKNARAIAIRAGAQSAGFRAITNFIEEMATTTISTASEISRSAMKISLTSVSQMRATSAVQHYESVRAKAPDAKFIKSIDESAKRAQTYLQEQNVEFRKLLYVLEGQLSETEKQIRSAPVIAATSKVEASMAGSFQSQLEVIALSIEDSAQAIGEHLKQSQRLLYETQMITNKNIGIRK